MIVAPDRIVYIYGLRDPRTMEMRYIGSSVDPRKRLGEHINDLQDKPLSKWIIRLSRDKIKPKLVILGRTKAWFRDDLEAMLIDQYEQSGAKLLNVNIPATSGRIKEVGLIPGLTDEIVECGQCKFEYDAKLHRTCPECSYHCNWRPLQAAWESGYHAKDGTRNPYGSMLRSFYGRTWQAGYNFRNRSEETE